jgi:Cys-tRNA(Pro)/Cys-tRNA(Cys) deacylase
MLKHADFPQPIETPADFARQLGYALPRITKTLLVRSTDQPRFALVVAPMGFRVNFQLLAQAMSAKRVEVAPALELQVHVGYPRNGVSPLGVDNMPIFMDHSLLEFDTILVGSGEMGEEIELAPRDLLSLTKAISLRLTL